MRKLIIGVFVTAVSALPLAARADWNDLKQRGANLENEGKKVETTGKADYDTGKKDLDTGKKDYAKGEVVEKKTVTTYKKGRNYATTTTKKIHKE